MLDDLDTQHFKQTLFTLRFDLLAVRRSGQETVQPVKLHQIPVGRIARMDTLQEQAMAKASQQQSVAYEFAAN